MIVGHALKIRAINKVSSELYNINHKFGLSLEQCHWVTSFHRAIPLLDRFTHELAIDIVANTWQISRTLA